MNFKQRDEQILKSFMELDGFIKGLWVHTQELPFDDRDFKTLVTELHRLVDDLKTKIEA